MSDNKRIVELIAESILLKQRIAELRKNVVDLELDLEELQDRITKLVKISRD